MVGWTLRLQMEVKKITFLDDADFRYLGKPINTESSEVACSYRKLIEEKLRSLLEALSTETLPNFGVTTILSNQDLAGLC